MPSLIRDQAASTPEMLLVFGDELLLSLALTFESELAQAQAELGMISQEAANAITRACGEPPKIEDLAHQAAHAGTLAIPLVEHLRAVAMRQSGEEVAALVHKGATSQDLADTVMMMQARTGLELIQSEGARLASALASLARRHVDTPMLGRTLMQSALPISFGLKIAGWLAGLDDALARLTYEARGAIRLQLGGAAGTLTGLDGRGAELTETLARHLALPAAAAPWHSRREGVAGLGSALAIVTGAAGKIALDIALLSQGEVGEAREPMVAGRGGSSAMAHKRNPTSCQIALSAAARAPQLAAGLIAGLPQAHERGLGGWQAEAPALAELFQLAHGALAALAPAIEGLEVDTRRMAANLSAAQVGHDLGESVALARRLIDQHQKEA